MPRPGPSRRSIKDQGGLAKRKSVQKSDNVGLLMRDHQDLDEVLFTYVVNTEMVYDEMDFTIEEFAEITGADLDELINEINQVIRR